MNASDIAGFVVQWAVVNVAALVVLTVLSYVSSLYALDWLASLDRWLYARSYKRSEQPRLENRDAHHDKPGD